MRRSIVFSSLLVAASVAAIWILAVAAPAGAIQCPQQHPQGAHIVPPCCPLPPARDGQTAQPICCTTTQCPCQTACCPQGGTCCPQGGTCCSPTCSPGVPSITSSPSPSKAGQKVVISGTAGSGATVALWRELAGQSSFKQVSTTSADSTGKYTFTLARGTVMTDQQWYVTSNGARSTTVSQQVRALVSVAAFVVAHTVALRGHVTPSHAGERVLIEVNHGATWQVIARPRLGRGSGYSVSHRFAKSGPVKLRVVFAGDSRNTRSTSSTLRLTVRP